MKIIGKTDGGFILQATTSDIQKLVGWYYDETPTPTFKVGDDIKVSDMFMQMKNIKDMEKKLTQTAASLRMCANQIEISAPIVASSVEEKEE